MDALETFASGATTSQSIGWSTLPTPKLAAARFGMQFSICFASLVFALAGPVMRIAPASAIASVTYSGNAWSTGACPIPMVLTLSDVVSSSRTERRF